MPVVQHGVEGRVGALEAVIRRDQHDLALALHDGDGVETASRKPMLPFLPVKIALAFTVGRIRSSFSSSSRALSLFMVATSFFQIAEPPQRSQGTAVSFTRTAGPPM